MFINNICRSIILRIQMVFAGDAYFLNDRRGPQPASTSHSKGKYYG